MEQFIKTIKAWAEKNNHVESVIIAGSYARGTNTDTSDLDIVMITTNKSEMLDKQEFVNCFGSVLKKQTEYYGKCTSVRVWYKSGEEIEFGLVEPSWIAVPLDGGTRKVLSDGYKVLIDKKAYFSNLNLNK